MAQRFYIPPEQIHNDRFILTGSEAHHAIRVLRKKVGDTLELFDGKDSSFTGQIRSLDEDCVEGILLEKKVASAIPSASLILYQALIKGPKWDWLVEKATEIGVAKLVPILTARTIIKPSNQSAAERWKRIALAASKQSGRNKVMEISEPKPFAQAVSELPKDGIMLIPWEKELNKTVRDVFAELDVDVIPAKAGTQSNDVGLGPDFRRGDGEKRAQSVSVFIGPEGGWESQEVDLAVRQGAIPVTLGPTLLRSETAGLIASALVLAEIEMGNNQ